MCAMHQSDRSDSLSGTPDQLSRVLRCTPTEVSAAVDDLKSTGAANVSIRNDVVTLVCRRFQREKRERLMTLNRVNKHRCNGDETEMKRGCNDPSSSSSSFTLQKTVEEKIREWMKTHRLIEWNPKNEGIAAQMVRVGGWDEMVADVERAIKKTRGKNGTLEYALTSMMDRHAEGDAPKELPKQKSEREDN